MRTETEIKTIYVSNDGRKKSYCKDDIIEYEKRQLKAIFEKRTEIAYISISTSLYCFAKGDVKSFKEFYPEAHLDNIEDDEEGYFVYVHDSSYDDVGENYNLYREEDYKKLVGKKINRYNNILVNIADGIMVKETFKA